MALTQSAKLDRRGPAPSGSYGYQVAAGEQVWRGSIVALNAAGTLQRVQTAGSVVIVGVCSQDYSNTLSATPSAQRIVVERGRYQFAVAGATPSTVGQLVYATDDSTCTTSSTTGTVANLGFGTLDGLDNGLPFVRVNGS